MTADARWVLTLYVSGASPQSAAAIRAVQGLCDEELAGHVDLDIVDIQSSMLPPGGKIYAIPTLVRHKPSPERYLVGDLTDMGRVREGLDLGPSLDAPVLPEGLGT